MTEVSATTQSFTLVDAALKPELLVSADFFGVELPDSGNITGIRKAFKEQGIDDNQYNVFVAAVEAKRIADEEALVEKARLAEEEANSPALDEKESNATTQQAESILIKMKRRNPSMNIRSVVNNDNSYKFTTRHPYQVVLTRDAEFIIGHYKGFSIALPSEVETFYGTDK